MDAMVLRRRKMIFFSDALKFQWQLFFGWLMLWQAKSDLSNKISGTRHQTSCRTDVRVGKRRDKTTTTIVVLIKPFES